jgi:histidinol phosphatase-like enzyme
MGQLSHPQRYNRQILGKSCFSLQQFAASPHPLDSIIRNQEGIINNKAEHHQFQFINIHFRIDNKLSRDTLITNQTTCPHQKEQFALCFMPKGNML